MGGVRFVHGDIDSNEAEQAAMYGPLSNTMEQVSYPVAAQPDNQSTVSSSTTTSGTAPHMMGANWDKHNPGTNPPIMNAIIAATGVRFANDTNGSNGENKENDTLPPIHSTTNNNPNRPRSAKETLTIANSVNPSHTTGPVISSSTIPNPHPLLPTSRPPSSSTQPPHTGKSVTANTYQSDIGGVHGDNQSESGNHSAILSSPDAVTLGGGYVALRPSSAGGTIILNSDSSLAKVAPAMPAALIRTSNPFRITPGEGN